MCIRDRVIDTVSGKAGDTVEIPIRFKDVPSSGINNCDFILWYEPDVLEITSINPGAIVTGGKEDFKSHINKDRGRLSFMFVDETGVGDRMIQADGVFAVVTATIKSTAPDGLSKITKANDGAFSDYNLNLIDASIVCLLYTSRCV